MNAASRPAQRRSEVRLMVVDARQGPVAHAQFRDLPNYLQPGDLLIVNDAATLPAALPGRGPAGEPLELRLSAQLGPNCFRAVLFGEGSWLDDTMERPAPPAVQVGHGLVFGERLTAHGASRGC